MRAYKPASVSGQIFDIGLAWETKNRNHSVLVYYFENSNAFHLFKTWKLGTTE